MFEHLISLHSILRWLVVFALSYTVIHALLGYKKQKSFIKYDNALRHWTATIVHIQLIVGMILFMKSPLVKYFWGNFRTASENFDALFYGCIHILLMFTAIVIITIGSALAKRKKRDADKFKTIFVWYAIGLIIIFIAIPWPFSPLSNRPYFR